MAEYASDSVDVTYAATSASATPDLDRTLTQVHASPTKHFAERVTVATGGTTVGTMTNLTTVETLYVWNRDATNYVTLTYSTVGGPGQVMRILAGQWCKLLNMTAASNLVIQANVAAVICDLIGIGT